MDSLFQLAKYNSKNIKIIESLISKEPESPLKKLYSIVFSDKVIDDNQAMFILYGRKKLSTFSRLKTKLKDILIKSTLLLSSHLETKDSYTNESMNQFRYTIASKFLGLLKNSKLSIEIAEKTLVKSIKYESTENILLLLRIIIRYYGTQHFDNKRLSKYLTIQEKYLRIHALEIKAENYFMDLHSTQLNSLATPLDTNKEKAKNYVNELEQINDIVTPMFLYCKYRVNAIYCEYQRDYESLLTISDKIVKDLSKPEYKTNDSVHGINLRIAWALIQAGRNEHAIIISTKDMKTIPLGSSGWYFMAHYKLKALLYKGDYRNSVELIKMMIENPFFSKISENYRELFYTTLGYIHLIVDSGLAGDPKKYKKILPDFKIGKFLNTTPVFSKDKRGINVSILLMHIAILLQRKNYNAIIDRIDSLNQYAYRYLRKDDTFRSNCMIKMVIQMTKADFHPIRTDRYTKDLLQQLEQVKLAGSGENIETEIIPYEVLWKIMVKAL